MHDAAVDQTVSSSFWVVRVLFGDCKNSKKISRRDDCVADLSPHIREETSGEDEQSNPAKDRNDFLPGLAHRRLIAIRNDEKNHENHNQNRDVSDRLMQLSSGK